MHGRLEGHTTHARPSALRDACAVSILARSLVDLGLDGDPFRVLITLGPGGRGGSRRPRHDSHEKLLGFEELVIVSKPRHPEAPRSIRKAWAIVSSQARSGSRAR